MFNKVIWSEGMFLQPQHFQQQDRYLEGVVNGRCLGLRPYDRGFYQLSIDTNLLRSGKLSITGCKGIFADGTPFDLPEQDALPQPLEIPLEVRDEIVYLAVALRRMGAAETDNSTGEADNLARYRIEERSVKDNTGGSQGEAPLQIGNLKTVLLFHRQERSGFSCLAVARIIEVQSDRTIVLDDHFIPPSLNCAATAQLSGFLQELHGLLNTRGAAIAERVVMAGHGGVAEIADFLLLQLVNRYQPLFGHFANTAGLHPEVFYRHAIQLAGEMGTHFRADKRPAPLPMYNHDNLQATFGPLMEELRRLLGQVYQPTAVKIPLSKPKYGVYAAKRPDPHLINNALFVLAANAQLPPETLRQRFPQQVKIGPVEEIQRLVNSALPGIAIDPLPVAPRQIPIHAGFTYFELSRQGPLWEKMATSGGFAIQIGGSFPGLELEFWAIRKGSAE